MIDQDTWNGWRADVLAILGKREPRYRYLARNEYAPRLGVGHLLAKDAERCPCKDCRERRARQEAAA